MKRKNLLLVVFSLFVIQIAQAQYFKHLGMKEGLSQLSVLSIYQDQLGRMWFGTREGVSVYDGKLMTVYKPWSDEYRKSKKRVLPTNEVNMIVGDKEGNVFMQAEGALIKYDIRKETFHQIRSKDITAVTSYEGTIWCIARDSVFTYDAMADRLQFRQKTGLPYVLTLLVSGSKLWMGTKHGLYLSEKGQSTCVLPDAEIYRLFESSRKELWIGSRMKGLYRILQDGKLVKEPHDSSLGSGVVSNQIRGFAEDNRGNIWFGTFDGVQVYNPFTKKYTLHRHEPRQGALSHSSVFSLYKDRQGTLWMGTYYGGVNYFHPESDLFSFYTSDVRRNDCLNFPLIGPMIEDKDRLLWVCTDGGGLNCLDRKTNTFTYYTAGGRQALPHNNTKSICYDRKRDFIYVGTYTGGLSRYDRKTGTFYNYLEHYQQTGKGPNDVIFQVVFKDDCLYVSARNGFFVMDADSLEFRLINKEDYYLSFEIDSYGYAWLTSGLSLYRIRLNGSGKREAFDLEKSDSRNKIVKMYESKDKTMYIGTLGAGFYAYQPKEKILTHYTVEKNKILSNYCYNLVETPQNQMLITSDKGITLFSPFTQASRSIELGMGGAISSIADGCGAFVTEDEEIFVGGVDGMISFREEDLDVEEEGGALYYSDLYIHNARVSPEDSTGILKQTMPFTEQIELSAHQNNLIVQFSNSNYVDILKNNRYEYRLEGFDKDWIHTTQMSLYYTNLPPGTYTLKVREIAHSLNTGERSEIAMRITIHRPWYSTFWAWTIYLLLTGSILYWQWHIRLAKKVLAFSLERERMEKERIEELNQVKLRFFTNISHEFRTPLTLILAQIEALLQFELMPSVRNRMLRVYKNATHMRYLISELLDFRKQEQGYLTLKVEHQDVVLFAREIYLSFYEYSQKRHITYSFEHTDPSINLWFDPSQLQKVVFNLLSNAFKYTQEGGNILVSVQKLRDRVEIKVKDTGRGIPEVLVHKIFDRFYQVDHSGTEVTQGTGIGLALTKGLVEMHKGEIKVESVVGQGSTFTVLLPMGSAHFSKEELRHAKTAISPAFVPDTDETEWREVEEEDMEKLDETASVAKPTILIVEDNPEISEMLEEIFMPIYHVLKASDGKEGFELTRQIQPDIVLSDVMMPQMSGKEMCYKIKNSFDVSHIPVVLLTAQTSVEYTIEGYMFGADDYITKPFNVKLLVSRCNNLVKNRKLLIEKFKTRENPTVSVSAATAMNMNEQKLIEKATEIIRCNFENTDFDMNALATELGLGRSKLFSRIKELTGLTPNEFTLKLKLEEAMRLLNDEPLCTIAEISYKLGFTSPRYFSRCFKTFYGVAPQNYRILSS